MEISDAQLDRIYDSINKLLRERRFSDVNELMKRQDISFISTDNMITYLTATLPVSRKINYRREFYKKVKEELTRRGEYEEHLLDGLER